MSNYDNYVTVLGMEEGEKIRLRAEDVNGENQVELRFENTNDDGMQVMQFFLKPESYLSLLSLLAQKAEKAARIAREEKAGTWGV